jgi:heme-degrading monooxygenase HmoA
MCRDVRFSLNQCHFTMIQGHMEDFRKGPLYSKLIASLRGIGVKPSIITHHDFPEAIPSAPYLEYAMITLVDPSPSTISKFDSSVQGFKHFLTESKGFKGWTFAPEYEDPKKVLAVIGWDAKEDFDAFLKSDGHKGWAEGFGKLVGDVVVGAPDVWLAKSVEVATVGLKEAGLA